MVKKGCRQTKEHIDKRVNARKKNGSYSIPNKSWFKIGHIGIGKGIPRTKEVRVKITNTKLAKHFKHSELTKQKLRENKRGKTYEEMYGYEKAKEMKNKVSKRMKGNLNPSKRLDVRNKISKKNKQLYKDGKLKSINYWLGKKRSIETLQKISASKQGILLNEWSGFISFEPYSCDWKETLKRSIRERNNYICQICNKYGNSVHHIDYNKKNCNPDNLVTLCVICHTKTNSNRKFWIEFFKNRRKNI